MSGPETPDPDSLPTRPPLLPPFRANPYQSDYALAPPPANKTEAIQLRLMQMLAIELLKEAKGFGVKNIEMYAPEGSFAALKDKRDLITQMMAIGYPDGNQRAADWGDEEEGTPPGGVTAIASWGGDMVSHRADYGPYKTASAEHIMQVLFPRWAEHFLPKNADYGDQHRYALGPRAEWVGIDRKVTKLEKAIWSEEDMNGEGVPEMLHDLIGQCFILLDLLDGNWEPRSRNVRRGP